MALRLALLPVYGPPKPFIHDEYAYLLQADTFALGRLTNPTPPCWKQFISIYVLVQPTYTAEYQVGQAAFMAAGKILTGFPWAGVVASMGVLCSAVYWAFLGWMPPVWALLGGLLVDIEIGVLSYWMNSYWGGCVPAIGGALLLGALPRIRREHRVRNSVLIAIGAAILLNSRTLEGGLVLLIAAGFLFWWTFVDGAIPVRTLLYRITPVLACLLAATALFMAHYNARVTGSSTNFPYLLYRSRYGLPQGFLWQKPLVLKTEMPVDVRAEYTAQLEQHARRDSVKGLVLSTASKVRRFWTFYIGVPLTVPLVMLPFIWRDRKMRIAVWALVIVVGFENMTFFAFFPHYAAAVMVPIFVVILECIRQMRNRGAAGLFLSRALPVVCGFGLAIPVMGRIAEPLLPRAMAGITKLWAPEFEHWVSREQFTPYLERQPGPQLVLVHYDPAKHNNDNAWVYNTADLEHAKVVWAREGTPEEDRALFEHFSGRRVWLGEPDASPPRIVPYEAVGKYAAAANSKPLSNR